jgi:hypothetical protein
MLFNVAEIAEIHHNKFGFVFAELNLFASISKSLDNFLPIVAVKIGESAIAQTN